MKANIYSAEKSGWVFCAEAQSAEYLHPTEKLLKDWLASDVGKAFSREFSPDKWLVVPKHTDYTAMIYTAEWRQQPRPSAELVVTKVLP